MFAHMDADTIRFALLLRLGPQKEDGDFMKNLSEEERRILEEETKRKRAEARTKPCTIAACKQVEQDVSMGIIERVSFIKQVDKAEATVQENLEEYEVLSAQNNANTIEADGLQQTLQALQHKEKKELKEKMSGLNKTKSSLEAQILKAQNELAALKELLEGASSSGPSDSGMGVTGAPQLPRVSLPQINFTLSPSSCPRVHCGNYRTTISGTKQWSCCMSEEEDAPGCSEDHSGSVKEAFVFKHREAYRPYTVGLAAHSAAHSAKLAGLHRPISGPPAMNKGFRDSRGSYGRDSLLSYFPSSFGAPSRNQSSAGLGGGLGTIEIDGDAGAQSPASPAGSRGGLSQPNRPAPSPSPSPSSPSAGLNAPLASPIKQKASALRPSTVGAGAARSFSPSVSWAPMPASSSSSPASPAPGVRSERGELSSGSTSGGGSGYGTRRSLGSPSRSSSTAPLSSLLPPSNPSINTFGQGHKPPQIPSYIVSKPVPEGWDGAHAAALGTGELIYSANRAHAMTTRPSFQPSLRTGLGSPDGYANSTLGLATLHYGSPKGVKSGEVRVVGRDVSIKRVGGRPLTAPWGPHLALTSTVSPATSLEHTCQRIW